MAARRATLWPLGPLLLAACAMPPAPEESRLRLRGGDVTGTVGYAVTTAEARAEVEARCAAAGLRLGTMALGRIEDGQRRLSASCV